jgi:hypothetical protein
MVVDVFVHRFQAGLARLITDGGVPMLVPPPPKTAV